MNFFQQLSQKMTLRRRILALGGALLLLVLFIFLSTYRGKLGLTLANRWFTYDNDDNNITFAHTARSEDLFYGVNYKLLICSDSFLQLLSPSGKVLIREQATFANPALSTNGKQAVVYDAGGQNLFILSKNKLAVSLSLDSEQYIKAATINQSGWVAVTVKESGYRGVVHIYNGSQQPLMSIKLSTYYPANAVVTPDNQGIYILTEGQKDGVFESRLLYYTFDDDAEPKTKISLGDQLVLALNSSASRSIVLTENALYILLPSGELFSQYDFRGNYLTRASLEGRNFSAVLLSPSQTGNTGTLITIDQQGEILGSLEINEQVLDLVCSENYVAVLTANRLVLYNKSLSRELSSTENIQGIRSIALYQDGSLSMISDELARLYIP